MLAATIITRSVCVLVLAVVVYAATAVVVHKAAAWLDGDRR